LIAYTPDWGWWGGLGLAIAALGVVIFVHELGHFLVAKACGVKCEKFYLGFDIAGLKICKFRYGETEYGIGILPLGGYVKMLGQEDNPARLREELQRAQAAAPADSLSLAPLPGQLSESAPAALPSEVSSLTVPPPAVASPAVPPLEVPSPEEQAAAREALYNPRSYLAKSVPQRMAIISAGVIMNMIFAFIFAMIAYTLGVRQIACGVGTVVAGGPAWQADLHSGDKIVEINGKKALLFRDLLQKIPVADDLSKGIPLEISRPGDLKPFTLKVFPSSEQQGTPMLGLQSPTSTLLSARGTPAQPAMPALPGTPAAAAQPPLEPGDRVLEIDGRPVSNCGDVNRQLALNVDRPMHIVVQRPGANAKDEPLPAGSGKQVSVEIAPHKVQQLGLIFEMGDIVAIQAESPAALAKAPSDGSSLKNGDLIEAINGKSPGDPMSLPYRIRSMGDMVTLTVSRKEGKGTVDIPVKVRPTDRIEPPAMEGSPLAVPALGIAYVVLNRVHDVLPDSPAARAGIKPGDVVTHVALHPPAELVKQRKLREVMEVDLSEKQREWPSFFWAMQMAPAESQVVVTLADGRSPKMPLMVDDHWYQPDRGLNFEPLWIDQRASSFGQAAELGYEETLGATKFVYNVLRKLGRQISLKNLVGPIGILDQAARVAQSGWSDLLLFITMISANLAVINFLPIPVLDGGHMIFLLYEGIRGKPASERVQLALSYLGLLFILALMVWVIGLDLSRLWQH
jgi:regulator of sigma E protease